MSTFKVELNMSEVQDIDKGTSNICSQSKVRVDTHVSSNSLFYTWTVGNFLECIKLPDSRILSPEFEFAGAKWRLWFHAICKNDKLDKVKIRLMNSEKCYSGYYIKYKFSFLNVDGSLTSKENSSFFYSRSNLGHRLMFKYNEKNKSTSFIVNGTLTVHCELFVLSSEMGNDHVSVTDTSNQSDNAFQKLANKVKNYPSSGLLQSKSSSQVQKNANESKRPFSHSFSRAIPVDEEFLRRKKRNCFTDFILLLSFSLMLLFACEVCRKESCLKGKSSLNMNMTEVNELIVDSTLKIRVIAEALNLTEIKVKSSELLAWYHENYNMSDRNFPLSGEKISPFVISDNLILNVSASTDETAVANDTEKFSDNLILNVSSTTDETALANDTGKFIDNEH